jgi:LPS export ABC transporter protein LptC
MQMWIIDQNANQKIMGWIKTAALPVVLALLLFTASGCRRGSRGAERLAEDTSAAQSSNTNLTFNNITLEQANEKGQTLWKVKAATATYTPDKQVAQVQSPHGELYQDGKPIYRVEAKQGEVQQDGNRIVLRGNVVATDTQSGAVLHGDELHWDPKQDNLIVQGNLRGTHPDVTMTANQAQLHNRQRRMELSGNVVAIATKEPRLRLQAEKLVWLMKEQKVTSDRPVKIQRLEGKNNKVTDQASGNQAEVGLGPNKTVHLKQNARLNTLDPPLQIAGNSLIWDVKAKTIVADQPVTVVNQQQQVTATANRGRMELQPKVAYLNGNVHAIGKRNNSQLDSDRLTWTIPSQLLVAEGNVVYKQPNPPATLRGSKAVGKLNNQTVTVTGGNGGRVVTEIVPQTLK